MTVTAAVLLGASLAPQAAAAATTATTPGAAPARTASPAPTPEETASEQAKKTGKPVEVLARRTEASQLFANPSGTFTQEQYALPRWTRQDGKLVTIDTNLAPGGDGRIAPKATTTGVSFSAGGKGPAVTLMRDGRKLSLSWPTPLPKPRTQGDTATYPEVLPGVDLLLRAGNSGFSQLFVVKTPEAAANPALASLRFAMATDGLKVSSDSTGNVTAVDTAGQEVFTAPAPRMWDSSVSAEVSRARAAAAPTPPTDRFEPGHGAKQAVMGLALGTDSLTVKPDRPLLTGEGTTYPVYIDPTFSAPGKREAWALAYKKTPGTAYYNGAGWHNSDGSVGTNEARVGYENVTDGLARSFFRMDSNNLWNTRKKIKKSTFRIKNIWSWSCQDSKVEVWFTGGISAGTTWSSQDNAGMWATKLDDVNESLGWPGGGDGCPPAGNLAFDVTYAANQAATRKLNDITLGLRATYETVVSSWKKFDAGTASLSTEYNTYPNAPTNIDTSPDTAADLCAAGEPMVVRTIGNTDTTLSGTFSDPDKGTVKARFNLWPTGHGGPSNEVNQVVDVPSGKGAKLVVLKTTLKKLLTDAGVTGTGTFTWHARAEDGELAGAWSPVCSFRFDATRPSLAPSVTSTQFPDGSDGWPETTGMARTKGTFQVKDMDPEPIAAYEYWTDWDPTVRKISFHMAGTTTVNLEFTPPSVGRHAVNVRAVDMGGNISDTTRYWFYANGPGIPDKPGDLNGDGIADFYGVRADGDLWYYAGHGNGNMAPYSVASNQDFTGASITRRGDWTSDGYEDLLALVPGEDEKTLSVFPNNGFGHACSAINEQADGESKYCRFDAIELDVMAKTNNHWSTATEILAIGDVDGPLDINGDGVIDPAVDQPGRPDLIVKEGGKLWLYFGGASRFLDERDPVLVGTGGWTDFALAAPGDRDKNGHVDLLAQNKVNGELRFYPGVDTNGDRTDGEGIGRGSTSVVIGTNWTGTNRPLFTAVPDANGDGTPDIWATTSDDKLYFYPNSLGSGTATGFGGWNGFRDLA